MNYGTGETEIQLLVMELVTPGIKKDSDKDLLSSNLHFVTLILNN